MKTSRDLLRQAAREGKLAIKTFLGLSIASESDVPDDCTRCDCRVAELILANADVVTKKMCDDFEKNKRVRTALKPLVFFPADSTNRVWEDAFIKEAVGEPRWRKTWNSQKKGMNWPE